MSGMPKPRGVLRSPQIAGDGRNAGIVSRPTSRVNRMQEGQIYPPRGEGVHNATNEVARRAIRSLVDYIQEGGRPRDTAQALAIQEGLSVSGIASITGMSVESVRRELNRLGDAGLIEKHDNPDGYDGPRYSLRAPLLPMRPPSHLHS